MVANQSSSGGGYTIDLAYPSEFDSSQSPLRMCWAALSAGAAPPLLGDAFSYCDLGCGDGSSLNVLAGCYPAARFVGIDINPDHIARARSLAERGGLKNVRYIEASFADLHAIDCGDFEFIVTMGIYSWLPANLRHAVREFVQERLKAGGLFAVHYLAMPGAASSDLVASYIRYFGQSGTGGTAGRFATGLAELKQIAPQTKLFQADLFAESWIRKVDSLPQAALIHDYMNREAPAFHFHEIAAELAAIGLDYCGSSRLADNHAELRLSAAQIEAFRSITANKDRIHRESVLDLMAHAQNRADLYIRGSADGPSRLCDAPGLLLLRTGDQNDLQARRTMSVKFAADLTSDLHTEVLNLCQKQALSVQAVVAHSALVKFPPQAVETAILQLVAKRFLSVLIAEPPRVDIDSTRRYRFSSQLNQAIFDEQVVSPMPVYLASRILGGSIEIPEPVRIRLYAFLGGDLERIWRAFRDRSARQAPGDRVVPLDVFRQRISASLPGFVAGELPYLLRFGMLEQDV